MLLTQDTHFMDITQMLGRWGQGDEVARDQIMSRLYPELERLAASQLSRNARGETLNTRVLVHEAYEKLARSSVDVESRRHFMALAARVMRQVIVDYARRRSAQRRGGDVVHYSFEDLQFSVADNPDEILLLSQVLDQLKVLGEPFVSVIECRYFAGMTLDETAEALDLSRRTVQRHWARGRAWLKRGMREAVEAQEAGPLRAGD